VSNPSIEIGYGRAKVMCGGFPHPMAPTLGSLTPLLSW
jgi:hypothetical protein